MSNKYTTIANDIKEKIKKGVYIPGGNIPIEIDMCDSYGVSRITVQKAMKLLIEEGYVHRISGKGTFVNEDLVINDNSSFTFVIFPNNEPGFFDIIHGIENELINAKSLCSMHFLSDSDAPSMTSNKLDLMLTNLLSFKPKGFIVYPSNSKIGVQAYKEIQKRGISLVLLDKECDDFSTDVVVTDNYAGMKNLTQHVIDRGHKNIGYISFQMDFGDSVLKRRNAFFDCMDANGLKVKESMCKVDNSNMDDINRSVREIIKENPELTTIVCSNDSIAGVCYEVFEQLNIKIPNDISVCSFDGQKKFRSLTPKLTTMSQNLQEIGRMAARLILMRQRDTFLPPDMQIKFTLPTTFLDCDSVKNLNI